MDQGTLTFSIDGSKPLNKQFTDQRLTEGPIKFAAALNNNTSIVIL